MMDFLNRRPGQDMEMWPEANDIVHQFVPCVMDAAGLPAAAEVLRRLAPVRCGRTLADAAEVLSGLLTPPTDGGPWSPVIVDTAFWAAAAIWSAHRGDYKSFREHSERMRAALSAGMPEDTVH